MPRIAELRQRFTELIPELAKFGVVGVTGAVIDLGGAAYLHGAMHVEALSAKRHSYTYLLGTLSDQVGEHAVDTDTGEK